MLLIGLGRFGRHIARRLYDLDHQVLAVDSNEDCVNRVLSYVTSAQIGDSTNPAFLATLGVKEFDVCIVAIGDDFQSSLETVALLKELGAREVSSPERRGRGGLPGKTAGILGSSALHFRSHAGLYRAGRGLFPV